MHNPTESNSNPETIAQIHSHFGVSDFNANGFAKKPVACPRGHSEDDKKPACYSSSSSRTRMGSSWTRLSWASLVSKASQPVEIAVATCKASGVRRL